MPRIAMALTSKFVHTIYRITAIKIPVRTVQTFKKKKYSTGIVNTYPF